MYFMIFEYLSKNSGARFGQSKADYKKQLREEKESLSELQRVLKERLDTIERSEGDLRCGEGVQKLHSTVGNTRMGKLYYMPSVKGQDPVQ